MNSLAIERAAIVAAVTPAISRAPFRRGGLIVRGDGGSLLRVRTCEGPRVYGETLRDDELAQLLTTGHAIEVPEVPYVEGAELWIFGHERRAAWSCSGLSVVVLPSVRADASLSAWRSQALEYAQSFAREGDWTLAAESAEEAQAYCRDLDVEVLAFLCLALERCDRLTRAIGLLTMARRSRGESFGALVHAALQAERARYPA